VKEVPGIGGREAKLLHRRRLLFVTQLPLIPLFQKIAAMVPGSLRLPGDHKCDDPKLRCLQSDLRYRGDRA
jgi:hypothetical protein